MKIDGVGKTTYIPKSVATGLDAQCASVKSEIDRINKQIEQVSKNDKLSMEEKQAKKKEYQDQIRELTKTLEELQLEKEREEKQVEDHMKALAREAKKDRPKEDTVAVVMDQLSMEGLLRADSASKGNDALDQIKTNMAGQKRILEKEIELDAGRGVDTTYKSDIVSKIDKNIEKMSEKMGENVQDSFSEIDDISQGIKEEKEDKNHNGIEDEKEKKDKIGQNVDEYR